MEELILTTLPKEIYRFSATSTKMIFFTELEKINFKICLKKQKTLIVKVTLRKKNRPGEIILSGFILYYKAMAIKSVWFWHKNRHIDQWNRTPKVNRLMVN